MKYVCGCSNIPAYDWVSAEGLLELPSAVLASRVMMADAEVVKG